MNDSEISSLIDRIDDLVRKVEYLEDEHKSLVSKVEDLEYKMVYDVQMKDGY